MADTIPNIVVPAKTVVDIYADAGVIAAGIAVGDQITVKILGEGEARLYSGASLAGEPTSSTGYTPIDERDQFTNKIGDSGAFIWSTQGCTISINTSWDKSGANEVTAVSSIPTGIVSPVVRTLELTAGDAGTLGGYRFEVEINELFGIDEEKYFLYDMPLDSTGVAVALQNRSFQPAAAYAEYEVLWDSTGFVAGTEIPSFNTNKRSSATAEMKIYRLDDGTNPTADGIIRESGFTGQAGNVIARSGSIDPSLGFRLYDDSFFILKVINGGTAQKIKVTYEFLELQLSKLDQ